MKIIRLPLKDQLNKARQNEQKITNLIGVTHLVVDNPERYHNALRQAHNKIGDILSDVEKARKIIARYQPDHSEDQRPSAL